MPVLLLGTVKLCDGIAIGIMHSKRSKRWKQAAETMYQHDLQK